MNRGSVPLVVGADGNPARAEADLQALVARDKQRDRDHGLSKFAGGLLNGVWFVGHVRQEIRRFHLSNSQAAAAFQTTPRAIRRWKAKRDLEKIDIGVERSRAFYRFVGVRSVNHAGHVYRPAEDIFVN